MAPDSNLSFLPLDQSIDWSVYAIKPTACLLVIDNVVSDDSLASIVAGAIGIGCTSFLTWGREADSLHDRIDDLLEDGSDDWLRILTTSHKKKNAEDLSNFLFVATFPNRPDVRYLIITDRPSEELKKIIVDPR
ncbi:DUF7684 family protein [Massilia antarctica]|uniref:DUF7684 family protein n=1 Tax=Massilia antarctica TaxID=2765360 RepID=UPI00403C0AC8